MPETRHPIALRLRDDSLERNRLTVFFRLILAIPHFVWLILWGVGAAIVLPFHWLWALIAGAPASGLHSFYASYVRYWTHVYAYVSIAANPYPPFLGEPGSYVVDVDIAECERQPRWTILLRLFLAVPPLVLAGLLIGGGGWSGGGSTSTGDSDTTYYGLQSVGGVLTVVAVLLWFSCLARGRSPRGLRDLALYCIGYAAQAYGYFALITRRYPNSSPALARPAPQPPHPIRAALDDDRRRSRLTVLFRLLLALPHFVWLTLWGVVMFFVIIINWFCALFAGRVPDALHRFTGAYLRYQTHVYAFLWLAANPFPGFLGRPGTYPYELEIDPPARQHRAVTFFRIILAVPALMLSSALSSVMLAAAFGGWVVSLLTARMPEGLRDLNAFCIKYGAQINAYVYLLTDRYPYSGPTLATAGPADAEPGLAAPPAAAPSPAPESPGGWAPPQPPPPPPPPPPGEGWRLDPPEGR